MYSRFLRMKSLCLFMAMFVFASFSIPTDLYAMPVSSAKSLSNTVRSQDYKRIVSILDVDVVKEKLIELGLTEKEIDIRLSALTDEQLHRLAKRADMVEVGAGSGTFLALSIFAFIGFLVFLFTTHTVKIEPKENE